MLGFDKCREAIAEAKKITSENDEFLDDLAEKNDEEERVFNLTPKDHPNREKAKKYLFWAAAQQNHMSGVQLKFMSPDQPYLAAMGSTLS